MMLRRVALVSLVCLAACSGEEHQDVRKWMDSEVKKMGTKIEPLPEAKPAAVAVYDPQGFEDPFSPNKIERLVETPTNRPKREAREPLEQFALEALKMVGTLQMGRVTYALVRAENSLHRVKVGNYVGQNEGQIVGINEAEITIKEFVQDASGQPAERISTIPLQEQEAKK